MKKYDVAIIGAGFGGLSTALTLQSAGLSVVLIDSLSKPGGRAYADSNHGYTFDRGPTIITAPFLIDDIFALSGAKREDYCKFVPVDPYYKVIFYDESSLSHYNDYDQLKAEIAAIAPDDVDGVFQFFQQSEKIFQKGFLELGEKNFSNLFSMFGVAPQLLRLNAVRPVYSMVSRYVKNSKIRQFLSFHPLLIGGNPFRASAVYSLINRLERAYGVFHAVGGMGTLADAFVKRFQEIGGTVFLSEMADVVDKDSNGTFCIQTTHQKIFSQKLVVNGDMYNIVQNTLINRAKPKKLFKTLQKADYSMSAFLLYLGTNKQWPHMQQHSIVLGPRYESLLSDIFYKKIEFDDFSFYLHMPTRTDSSLAPEGHEVVYALVPVPNLSSATNWNSYQHVLAEKVKDTLERRFLPGLRQSIVREKIFSPLNFEATLNSHLGNAFGLEPHLMQTAAFRPSNASSEVKGLYFVGANTQPGAGVPGVLLGSRITCRLLLEDMHSKNSKILQPLTQLPAAYEIINSL